MRNLSTLDKFRLNTPEVIAMWGWAGDSTCGMFALTSEFDRGTLIVIASSGMGWDHVSVSRRHRIPNWAEMEQTKRLFFNDDEVAMQLHVAVKDHINAHPHCLHLWRPNDGRAIPLPPKETVA